MHTDVSFFKSEFPYLWALLRFGSSGFGTKSLCGYLCSDIYLNSLTSICPDQNPCLFPVLPISSFISSSLMWLNDCYSELGFPAACWHSCPRHAPFLHWPGHLSFYCSHGLLPVMLLLGCQVLLLSPCLLWLDPYFSPSYLNSLSSSSIPVTISSVRSWILTISLQLIFLDMKQNCLSVFVSLEHIRHEESPEPLPAFHKTSRWLTGMKVC